jgi:hypothetical protein
MFDIGDNRPVIAKEIRRNKTLKERLETIRPGDALYIRQRECKLIADMLGVLDYRIPKVVSEYVIYYRYIYDRDTSYSLCPVCAVPIDCDGMRFCSRCGQNLKWISRRKMVCRQD